MTPRRSLRRCCNTKKGSITRLKAYEGSHEDRKPSSDSNFQQPAKDRLKYVSYRVSYSSHGRDVAALLKAKFAKPTLEYGLDEFRATHWSDGKEKLELYIVKSADIARAQIEATLSYEDPSTGWI